MGTFTASKETAGILDLPSVRPSILLAFGRVNLLTKELCLHLSLSLPFKFKNKKMTVDKSLPQGSHST